MSRRSDRRQDFTRADAVRFRQAELYLVVWSIGVVPTSRVEASDDGRPAGTLAVSLVEVAERLLREDRPHAVSLRRVGPGDADPRGRRHRVSEAVFTPSGPDAGEGKGWVLVVDSTPRDSSALILDATAINHGPIARIRLPQRIPDGFHGDWIPDA